MNSRPVDEVIRAEAVFKEEAQSNVFYSGENSREACVSFILSSDYFQ